MTKFRSRRRPRWLTAILWIARVVLVVTAFQISGLDTWVTQASLCAVDVDEACDDCPEEQDGEHCPPGCPDCHCLHRTVALPKDAREATRLVLFTELPVPESIPFEASVHHAPILPGLYRPPRLRA